MSFVVKLKTLTLRGVLRTLRHNLIERKI